MLFDKRPILPANESVEVKRTLERKLIKEQELSSALLHKQSLSGSLIFGLCIVALVTFAATQINTWITEERLKESIEVEGKLVFAKCGYIYKGVEFKIQQPVVNLQYEYVSLDGIARKFYTVAELNSVDACNFEYKNTHQKIKMWYERNNPDKASLYGVYPYSFGSLWFLIFAIPFLIAGVNEQRKINSARNFYKSRKISRKEKRGKLG